VSTKSGEGQKLASRVTETIIITELFHQELTGPPVCRLIPGETNKPVDTWWAFAPEFFVQFLNILGFPQTKVIRHQQLHCRTGTMCDMFTVVASRN
jgi:hypothetical protein